MQGSIKRAAAAQSRNSRLTRMSSNVEFFAKKASKTQVEILETVHDYKREHHFLSFVSKNEKSRWSWRSLKEEFRVKDSEMLFRKYQTRLHHKFFLFLLILNVFFNIIALFIYFFDKVSFCLL